MGKKNKSTWKDPSLMEPHESSGPRFGSPNPSVSISGHSFSSESTIPGPSRQQQGGWRQSGRPRIQDKTVFRASNKTSFPNDRADARHAPWDALPGEEIEKPKVTVLSRTNLKAHEIAVNEKGKAGQGATARTVSDLIDLESCDYEALEKDPTLPKAADDGALFGDNVEDDLAEDPFHAQVGRSLNGAVEQESAQDNVPETFVEPQYTSPQMYHEIFHEALSRPGRHRHHDHGYGGSYQHRGDQYDEQASHNNYTSEASQPESNPDMAYLHDPHEEPEYYQYEQYPQQQATSDESSRKTAISSPVATSIPQGAGKSISDSRLNPAVSSFTLVRAPQTGEVVTVDATSKPYVRPCRNEPLAKRPSIGRPNTKVLSFAVLKSRNDGTGEMDMFSIHSHLIRRYCPQLVLGAEQNDYIRQDGSYMIDQDSIVAPQFSLFVDWLYTGRLINEDDSPLSSGQLMRLYKFAVAEDIALLRDDILTDLCRLSRENPDYKPSPAMFYKFDPESMLCKLVADIWSNHDSDLHTGDIERAAQAYSDPKPMFRFMKLAWSQANKNSKPNKSKIRSPCDFHEHPEQREEEIDAPNRILWDWL